MTPAELQEARQRLHMSAADLGRALQLSGRDPGRLVRSWETGAARIPGPVQVAVRLMLDARKEARRQALDASAPKRTGNDGKPRQDPSLAHQDPDLPPPPAALVELLNRPFTRRRGPR